MPALQTALIRFAIRYRGIIIALACLLFAYGSWSFRDAKYDVFPEFAPPQVGIQTEAPGLTPEQVDLLVTRPLEIAINGISGVEALRSASIQGLSVVTVLFQPGSDIYRARQLVAERLAAAGSTLPRGIGPPVMTPLTSSASTVLIIGLTSATRSLMDLREFAERILRQRLLATEGVAKVTVFGGEVKSLQIQIRPQDLFRFDLGLDDIVAAASRATGLRGVGFVETANQRVLLQATVPPPTPEALASSVIASHEGVPVTLGDVAHVTVAPEPPVGGATIEGKPGVLLMVGQQYGSNTLEVTERVEAALGELRPGLEAEGITLHPDLFRPANFIVIATGSVEFALLLGAGLVVVILFLFLFDWRSSLISCTAIPLSLLVAVLALRWMGATLNTMTLGGLAIAIGEVVDDAVIDVENIVRRLRENRRSTTPLPAAQVVLNASLEVRGAVVYATFAVILAFAPVLVLPGLAGRLFAPLAAAYVLAVLASLAVALTVTPALSARLIGGRKAGEAVGDPPVARWSRRRYEALLRRVIRRPGLLILATLGLTGAAAATLPFFGGTFLPDLKEGHFILHMTTMPGTSLAESLRLGRLVSKTLLELPAVRSVAQHVGRAEAADDTSGTHDSEFEIDLKPGLGGAAQEAAESAIRAAVSGFPGVTISINTFLTERVEETFSGTTSSVAINLYGDDLDALDRTARDIADAVDDVPGAADVHVQAPPGLPLLAIRLRPEEVQRWGFAPVAVLDAIRTAYQGEIVGQAYESGHVHNVVVLLDPAERGTLGQIGDLPLRNPEGRHVLLRQLAEITESSGRYQVRHQQALPVQTVALDVHGRDLASVVAETKQRVAAKVKLPPGVYAVFAGTAEAEEKARRDLLIDSLIAGIGILLVLAIITRHWRNLVLVTVNLPFAFIGGVLAAFATGGVLSLGSIVGFVTLFGITLRNSIMMISHYEHLVAVEGRVWSKETAIAGAADRLVPILMTTLVTALGLLPLALGMNEPGREIEGPMAVVILGGLGTSMVLNLLVLPTLALRHGRFEPQSDAFAANFRP
jgi:CzcA family heavy metal efflux pump